jgi:hypothetical protein
MNGQKTSDVHTCMTIWSISWDETFLLEVNHKKVVKLNSIQNVVTTWRCWLGLPRLGTDTEDFFQEPVTLTPTWMRSMQQDAVDSESYCKTHGHPAESVLTVYSVREPMREKRTGKAQGADFGDSVGHEFRVVRASALPSVRDLLAAGLACTWAVLCWTKI